MGRGTLEGELRNQQARSWEVADTLSCRILESYRMLYPPGFPMLGMQLVLHGKVKMQLNGEVTVREGEEGMVVEQKGARRRVWEGRRAEAGGGGAGAGGGGGGGGGGGAGAGAAGGAQAESLNCAMQMSRTRECC
eukprot:765811-Hanusia_phi.AAC.1